MARAKKEMIDKSAFTLQIKVLYEQAQKDLYKYPDPSQRFEHDKALGRRDALGEVFKLLGYDDWDIQAFVDEINTAMGNPPTHGKLTGTRL